MALKEPISEECREGDCHKVARWKLYSTPHNVLRGKYCNEHIDAAFAALDGYEKRQAAVNAACGR